MSPVSALERSSPPDHPYPQQPSTTFGTSRSRGPNIAPKYGNSEKWLTRTGGSSIATERTCICQFKASTPSHRAPSCGRLPGFAVITRMLSPKRLGSTHPPIARQRTSLLVHRSLTCPFLSLNHFYQHRRSSRLCLGLFEGPPRELLHHVPPN